VKECLKLTDQLFYHGFPIVPFARTTTTVSRSVSSQWLVKIAHSLALEWAIFGTVIIP